MPTSLLINLLETAERHLFDPEHAAEPVGTISFGDNIELSLPPTSISLLIAAP